MKSQENKIDTKFEPGLELPGGCERSAMIGNMRELVVYIVNQDMYKARWTVLADGIKYDIVEDIEDFQAFDTPEIRENKRNEIRNKFLKLVEER